jgi:electron transfer flavoprotein alpha/beta subunit
MKKIILSVTFLFGALTFVAAQQGQGGGQGGGNMQERMAQMKQRLKDEVKLTDVQIDSVMAITQAFQPKQREIRMDQSMSDADKQTKMKALNEERAKRLEAAIGKESAQKVVEMTSRQRGGGGNGPQGQGNN